MTRAIETGPTMGLAVDLAVHPFLQADFDPATYLNNALPALSSSTTSAARSNHASAASIAEVSLQAQTLVSRLGSQTTRLSNTLTQLTDEIVRSGGRLAYEVELLRGEAIGLSDALHDGLRQDFEVFLPVKESRDSTQEQDVTQDSLPDVPIASMESSQPRILSKLHTLTAVRERLDAVIKLFDEAMNWPVAPVDNSTVSTTLISVTSPSYAEEARNLSAKAKEYVDNLRQEINTLVSNAIDGATLANERIDRLRSVADVWRATAEEKPRLSIVDELQRLVDEQNKTNGSTRKDVPVSKDYRYGGLDTKIVSETGYGFLNNLRNLKNEVYLD